MGILKQIIFFSVLYAMFNVAGAAIIKNKLLTNKITGFTDFLIFLFEPKIFCAVLFIFVSMFFSVKALSLSSFSSVIPLMTAVNFIITVSVGILFFKEHLSIMGYTGIVMILCGVFLLGKGYTVA